MNLKHGLPLAGVAILALLAGMFVNQSIINPEPSLDKQAPISALVYPTPRQLTGFELTDQHGQRFTPESLKGKWSLLFAGYTSCPDVCPTTLIQLKSAHKQLAMGDDLQVVLVSVDPKRDHQQKLKQYIDYFNPSFSAIRGDHPQLYPLTQQLGLVYSMSGDDPDNYLVDHSAAVALINPQGQLAALLKPKPQQPGKIAMVRGDDVAQDVALIISGRAANL
ncbi:SCO family protein [Paraferrimonas haliotis]|uniref:Photosynthetic protein synthase I n=1 Tax=Paraferrimonas haliotis TaxID=2013866 RepID=A0AA37WY94_9GAMM|nr:SCO family protein [Paraferrimonas haliotis]GLS83495.1 photosynthetic protein synthase I [Paraferrimonas haliotis]